MLFNTNSASALGSLAAAAKNKAPKKKAFDFTNKKGEVTTRRTKRKFYNRAIDAGLQPGTEKFARFIKKQERAEKEADGTSFKSFFSPKNIVKSALNPLHAAKQTGAFVKRHGAKILPIATVVASVVPIMAPAIPALRAAAAAQAVYSKKREYDKAKGAEREVKKQKSGAIKTLTDKGVDRTQAGKIVDMITAGAEPEDAMRAVLGSAPTVNVPSTEPPDSPLMQETPETVKLAFVDWVKTWRPQLYQAAAVEAPELVAEQSNANTISGLGDWTETLSSFANTFATVGSKVLSTVYEKKTLEAQLDRVKQGLPPAPTAVVQAKAKQQAIAAGEQVPFDFMSLLPWGAGLGAAGLVVYLLSRRRR